jgi:hypothetical protein
MVKVIQTVITIRTTFPRGERGTNLIIRRSISAMMRLFHGNEAWAVSLVRGFKYDAWVSKECTKFRVTLSGDQGDFGDRPTDVLMKPLKPSS